MPNIVKQLGLVYACTLIGILFTLFNGYPFVMWDSAYYMHHSLFESSNNDLIFRPLTYSILLGLFPHSFFTVLAQALWLVSLLWLFVKEYYPSKLGFALALSICVLATPMAWYTNYILPDIFTAIQVIAFLGILDLHNKFQQEKLIKGFFLGSYILASMMHYSNFIMTGFLVLLFFYFNRTKRLTAVLLLLPFLLLPSLHYIKADNFTVTNTAAIFLFSRIDALNITNPYFNETCFEKWDPLCVVNEKGFDIWGEGQGGAVDELGGLGAVKEELASVNEEILTEPNRFMDFVEGSLKNWWKQLRLPAGSFDISLEDPTVQTYVKQMGSDEMTLFENQALFKIPLTSMVHTLDKYWRLFFWGFLIIGLLSFKFMPPELQKTLIVLMIIVMIHSLICGVLTEPHARYQARFTWIIPFLILMFGYSKLPKWRAQKKPTTQS